MPPSTKNMAYVRRRPSMSEMEAQKNLPPILNRLNNAVKPAATPAMTANYPFSNSTNSRGMPMSEPPKPSCNMGEAMPMTPMPALTFMHSTIQSNQNWGIPQTLLTC